MDNTSRLSALGVVRVRAKLNQGKWSVRVSGASGVHAHGNPDASFDEAMDSAVRLLRWAEIAAGKREPRTVAQIAVEREEQVS